jgi:diguanylate cyclase (GGDEF)-like protein
MNLKDALIEIIETEQLFAFFQPIFCTQSSEVEGYEALIRGPSDSPLHSPQILFDVALECSLLSALELACRKISIARFVRLELKGKLFINISSMIFLLDDHPKGQTLSYLKEYNLSPDRVVIELSEKHPIDAPEILTKALIHYKKLGFQIAVDDLGSGYAGLKLWSKIMPDFVKIDRYFINQCHQDPVKREFIKSIINLGGTIQAKVIAEGVETEDEFQQLEELGLALYQGFLFARPEPFPIIGLPQLIKQHNRLERIPIHFEHEVSSLLQYVKPLIGTAITKDVADYLHKHPNVHSIPVIELNRPIGMVLRSHILELFSLPFGRELYERKLIKETMMRTPVIVESSLMLDEVAQLVTSEHDEKLLWHFIITNNGLYVGIGSVRDLLRKITLQQLQHARYANPLSLLPGNIPIYQRVNDLIKRRETFYFAYFDLNNFKPYNDIYGYAKGDQIIQLVAGLLKEHCDQEDFVGHIGGDDFVVIFQKQNWRSCCERILENFDTAIKAFYDDEHVKARGIQTKSRTGEQQFYGLLGLAIGVVEPDLVLCHSHNDVAELASSAKTEAKKNTHSSIFFCQRGGPGRE